MSLPFLLPMLLLYTLPAAVSELRFTARPALRHVRALFSALPHIFKKCAGYPLIFFGISAIMYRAFLFAPPHAEWYRSGYNGADSKFLEVPAVSSAENVRRTRLCAGSDFTI